MLKYCLYFMLCFSLFGQALAAEESPPIPIQSAADAQNPAPDLVKVGVYINDIQVIDLKQNNYLVDFYIWFSWNNAAINPAQSMEFVNQSDSSNTTVVNGYETPKVMADGSLYQIKHVQGKMAKKMDLHDYPFDQQNIQILIEDVKNDAATLRYLVDKVSLNPKLQLPGFIYQTPTLTASQYRYVTDFGETGSDATQYSRLTFDMPMQRPHVNAFMKNILPIMLAVICCTFAFLLHPSLIESRFQIAVTSLLSIVALQITSSQDLPSIEYMTLLDKLYVIGYLYCIVVVGALTLSTKVARMHGVEANPSGMLRAEKLDWKIGSTCFVIYILMTLYAMKVVF